MYGIDEYRDLYLLVRSISMKLKYRTVYLSLYTAKV